MPVKPLRPCNSSMCNELTDKTYCDKHQDKRTDKERYRYYDKYKRDKEASNFYNSKEWDRVRQQALIRDKGLCQHCLEGKQIVMADVVDHIIPVKVDWDKRLTLTNLQSLCHRCHNKKTGEDKKKYSRTVSK